MDGLIQGVDKWFLRIWIGRADDFDFPRIGLSFYKDMDGVLSINSLIQNYHSMYAKKIANFPNFLLLILLIFY